jgi:tRNA pseudouridine32 synthase/23S rRNA pseudouridine746 synthase
LLEFLCARLPAVADEWAQRLADGDVLDAQGQPVSAGSACVPNAVLWYWRTLPDERRVPFEVDVLHQDHDVVVVDKPHFMSVTPGGRHLQETVLVRLKRQLQIETLVPVHRLDHETAGLLMFTVRPEVRGVYHALLRERRVHKVYEAVAPFRGDLPLPTLCRHHIQERPGDAFMQMEVLPGEPNAETTVELIASFGAFAHYRLIPHTGRKHQLRAQMNALGIPIVGDRIYPTLWPMPAADAQPDFSNPLQLLARELVFDDPITGRQRRFVSRRRLALLDALS